MARKIVDLPLTVNGVLKWSGISITAVTGLVSFIWFVATLNASVATVKHDAEVRDQQQDRQLAEVRHDTTENAKALDETNRKLDVAIAILQRVEKQVTK